MYFDEAINIYGNGVGVVKISSNRKKYLVLIKLKFECTINTAEYEACIFELDAVL